MKTLCTRCRERPATNRTLGTCDVCAYREAMGEAAAARQVAAAEAERAREQAARPQRARS